MPNQRLKALQVELSVDPDRVGELIREVVEDVQGRAEADTRDIPFVMGLLHGALSTLGLEYTVHEAEKDELAGDDKGRYGAYTVYYHIPGHSTRRVDVTVQHGLLVGEAKRT